MADHVSWDCTVLHAHFNQVIGEGSTIWLYTIWLSGIVNFPTCVAGISSTDECITTSMVLIGIVRALIAIF